MTYNQTTKTMYDNTKLCPMFEMEFYEAYTVPTHGQFVKSLKNACRMIKIADNTLSTIDEDTYITGSTGTKVYGTVAAGYVKDSRTGEDASWIPAHMGFNLDAYTAEGANGAGLKELKFQHVLILGKDALTRTGLSGEDQVRVYVKGKGESGVLDPIDQRQSIGFKINSVGFGSTRLEAVVDYICIPTMAN
jgi:hypothetical protein